MAEEKKILKEENLEKVTGGAGVGAGVDGIAA